MAKCKKCGAELASGQNVCPECKATQDSFSLDIPALWKKFESFSKASDYTSAYTQQDIQDNKVFAILSYIPFVCLYPVIAVSGKSPFTKFHANQGLVLFALELVISILGAIVGFISMIPFLGVIIAVFGGIVLTVASVAVLAAVIYGIVLSALGKARDIPFVNRVKILK